MLGMSARIEARMVETIWRSREFNIATGHSSASTIHAYVEQFLERWFTRFSRVYLAGLPARSGGESARVRMRPATTSFPHCLNNCSAPRSRDSLPIQPRVHGLDHFFRIECAAQKLIDGFCLRHWIGDEFIVINGQNGKVRLFFEPVLHARHLAKKDLRQSFFAQGGARFALPLQHHPLRSEHFC